MLRLTADAAAAAAVLSDRLHRAEVASAEANYREGGVRRRAEYAETELRRLRGGGAPPPLPSTCVATAPTPAPAAAAAPSSSHPAASLPAAAAAAAHVALTLTAPVIAPTPPAAHAPPEPSLVSAELSVGRAEPDTRHLSAAVAAAVDAAAAAVVASAVPLPAVRPCFHPHPAARFWVWHGAAANSP
jgi:hypothetical protein